MTSPCLAPTGLFTVEVKSHAGNVSFNGVELTRNGQLFNKNFLGAGKVWRRSGLRDHLAKNLHQDIFVKPVLVFSSPHARLRVNGGSALGIFVTTAQDLALLLLCSPSLSIRFPVHFPRFYRKRARGTLRSIAGRRRFPCYDAPMKIKSAEFVKGIMGEDEILEDGIPQVAFIGRSNVGKSSVINSIVNRRDLAHSSSTAGRTREVNFFLVNKAFYLVDLPGYGYAKMSLENRDTLRKLIYWYLLYAHVEHRKVVIIIDAKVGVTDYDLEVLRRLDEDGKNVVVVANKVDKIRKSSYVAQMAEIQKAVGAHKVIPYSATGKIGVGELVNEISV